MSIKRKNHQGINPIVAGVAGAVAGVAGYAVLKDKKTRANIMEMAEDVKEQAMDYIGSKGKSKIQKAVSDTKKSTSKIAD